TSDSAPMPRLATCFGLLLVALLLAGCGGSGASAPTGGSAGAGGASARPAPTMLSAGRLRALVLRGVGEDFRAGTGAGPRGYGLCVRLGMRRVLDGPQLRRL